MSYKWSELEGRKTLKKAKESRERNQTNAEMNQSVSWLDMSLWSFESAARTEAIFEIGAREGRREKPKDPWKNSPLDRGPEKVKEWYHELGRWSTHQWPKTYRWREEGNGKNKMVRECFHTGHRMHLEIEATACFWVSVESGKWVIKEGKSHLKCKVWVWQKWTEPIWLLGLGEEMMEI
jgi:hypothetical protein